MLPFAEVNLMAVLGATIAATVLGFIYYGPLFGKPWMKLVGLTQTDASKDMGKTMSVGLLSSLIMNYFIGLVLIMTSPASMQEAIHVGLVLWLGFIVMENVGTAAWEKGPMKLVWINSGYSLVMMIVSVMILTHWA